MTHIPRNLQSSSFLAERLGKLAIAVAAFALNRRCHRWPLSVLVMLASLAGSHGFAAPPDEHEVKAAFLYKFALYVDWPSRAFVDDEDPFIIGISGPASRLALVEAVARGRHIKDRPIQVRAVHSAHDLAGVDLLFVARTERHNTAGLIDSVSGQPVLIVTEDEGSRVLKQGSAINFVIDDGRVRFDVGLGNGTEHGLHFSAQLLRVARIVHRDGTDEQ